MKESNSAGFSGPQINTTQKSQGKAHSVWGVCISSVCVRACVLAPVCVRAYNESVANVAHAVESRGVPRL